MILNWAHLSEQTIWHDNSTSDSLLISAHIYSMEGKSSTQNVQIGRFLLTCRLIMSYECQCAKMTKTTVLTVKIFNQQIYNMGKNQPLSANAFLPDVCHLRRFDGRLNRTLSEREKFLPPICSKFSIEWEWNNRISQDVRNSGIF